MRKHTILFFMAMLCSFLVVSACSSSSGGDSEDDDSFYSSMIERSLVSSGNNYRVKQALAKAAAGEEVTLAYIGGSITEGYMSEGDSYVIESHKAFQENFASGDGSHVHYINAGMGGTPSSVGMVRYKRDVLDKAADQGFPEPDVVFVEFAVNDSDDPTNGVAYESLVRDILAADNKPAVVLIFSVFRNHWNLQDRFIPIGNDYQLPMISIKDAVVPELEAGKLTYDEFFRDDYHPSTYGFGVMTDCITYLFTTIDSQETAANDITIPDDATIGTQFCGITMIDTNTDVDNDPNILSFDVGSFTGQDGAMRTYNYSMNTKIFPDNWYKNVTDENVPFTMTINCKNFVLLYKLSQSSSFGTAEVYVDDVLVETLDGNTADAWNNPWTVVLFDEDTTGEHTIKIQMADDSEDKYFTILAFGYTG